MGDERLFPIMGAPSIPWSLIAPCERQAQMNHGQSLQQLAARGGLSPYEAMCVIRCKRTRDVWACSEEGAVAELARLVDAHKDVRIAALEAELVEARAECERLRTECSVHGDQEHGGEAEELRQGIERLIRVHDGEDVPVYQLQKIVDDVDARDSCAFLERMQDSYGEKLKSSVRFLEAEVARLKSPEWVMAESDRLWRKIRVDYIELIYSDVDGGEDRCFVFVESRGTTGGINHEPADGSGDKPTLAAAYRALCEKGGR